MFFVIFLIDQGFFYAYWKPHRGHITKPIMLLVRIAHPACQMNLLWRHYFLFFDAESCDLSPEYQS